ncbi:MAG: CDP-glucose 4,6-dehydratase [bacterium]
MVNAEFWDGKRVLLTGSTGFKGSWLSLWLKLLGSELICYSLPPPTSPSLCELVRADEGATSIKGDVRDFELLQKTIQDNGPEIVIHMAAQSLVRRSYRDPLETYSTNVMGTANLLEAIRGAGSVKAAVNVTSDKCYENAGGGKGFVETDAMGGSDPYSSSKGCAELVTAAYARSFFSRDSGAAVASARAGNVIGGGDWAEDRLVPDIIKSFIEKRPVKIRNPEAVRPWQFVLEPLRGYLALAEKLYAHGREFASGWNFGPSMEDAKPVSWIAQEIARRWGSGADVEIDRGGQHPREAASLCLDWTKAKDRLGWTPAMDLPEAVDWTVAWYRKYAGDPSALRAFTEKQIIDYMELSKA